MSERNFRQLLTERQRETNSVLCVGFDPTPDKLPAIVRRCTPSLQAAMLLWMKEIFDATAPFMSLAKPNHAFWERFDGTRELTHLIAHMHYKKPGIPVFLDCKRGDIGNTQEQYRIGHFDLEGVDGMNYNGYMGDDTLKALIDKNHPGRSLVGLGRTSNPSAWKIQDLMLDNGQQVWERMVFEILLWSEELGVLDNAGVVMGAAHANPAKDKNPPIYARHLVRAREIARKRLWFLIPGIGTQGGFVEETIISAFAGAGTIAINSSSGIIFASQGDDFAEAAAREAEKLMLQMRNAGADCLKETA
ncbi:MAG: orotidine-5'-phosphate decarboxylase [Candidatus Andersenbacteria bacterium]